MPLSQIKKEEVSLVINKDDNFEYQETINYLGENGYIRVSNIREPGEFSVKGDVIDIGLSTMLTSNVEKAYLDHLREQLNKNI